MKWVIEMNIPDNYFKTTTVFRRIGNNDAKGMLSCGFIHKKSSAESNTNVISECYTGVLLINGSGQFIAPDGSETKLVQGCFFQRIPGKLHSTLVADDGQWLEFFISIDQDIYKELCLLNIFTSQEYVLHPGVTIGLLDICENYLNNLQKSAYFDLPYVFSRALDFLYTIHSYDTKQREEKHELIDEAIELLNQYALERVNIREIINKLGLGYENFRKIFKERTGISPLQYMIDYRINTAKSLLIDDKLSINEIAAYLGYNDVFFFSNQFKKYTGYTPNAFRKNLF